MISRRRVSGNEGRRKILVAELQGSRPLERPKSRWENVLQRLFEKQDVKAYNGFTWLTFWS
jgi:hypothetical protein